MTDQVNYEEMTKKELLAVIEELNTKLARRSGEGRKEEVLALLQERPMAIQDMADALGISNKNVSSQLCYLKKDGVRIATNADGQKHIEGFEYPADDPTETPTE